MRLSTRLLLPLIATVVTVMTAYAAWSLRQRETTLASQDRRETRAYATALGLALEAAFRDPERRDVQETIDRISLEPNIYGVAVYSPEGEVLYLAGPLEGAQADPLERILAALSSGDTTSLTRAAAGGESVFSVVRPLVAEDGTVVGGFEVLQPLSFLESEKARTRIRFLLNTLTLLATLTVLLLLLVRRLVAAPLERLVKGVRALESGDLTYRVSGDAGGGELAEVAAEFNRMADRLEEARAGLLREGEDRLALERRLRDTEKLAAVGDLAAGVAHEIAAPLHVIQGRAELLLRKANLGEAEVRNLAIIREQIRRITSIVQNLLEFARRREPRMVRLDLQQTVGAVAEFLEGEFARTGVTLERHGPTHLELDGDGELLFQVFVNLFLNAVHALEDHPGDRTIQVTLRRVEGPGAAGDEGPDLPGDSPRVRVEVEDSGPGVPESRRKEVFEPFFTTKASGAGTGLGLSIVRSIVAEHGGRIDLVDGASGGARVRIVLPARPTPPAGAGQTRTGTSLMSSGTAHDAPPDGSPVRTMAGTGKGTR
jgi:signal transduction histidine kinase